MFSLYDSSLAEKVSELTEAVYKLNERDAFDWFSLILPTIVSLVSIIIGYKLGGLQQKKIRKIEALNAVFRKVANLYMQIGIAHRKYFSDIYAVHEDTGIKDYSGIKNEIVRCMELTGDIKIELTTNGIEEQNSEISALLAKLAYVNIFTPEEVHKDNIKLMPEFDEAISISAEILKSFEQIVLKINK